MKKIQDAGFRIAEVPVHHYHRAFGDRSSSISAVSSARRSTSAGSGSSSWWSGVTVAPLGPGRVTAASRARSFMTSDYRDFYRGRRVLITGGLGFIGSNLARQLVDLGADVLLVDSLLPDYGGNLFNIDGIEDAAARQHRRRPAGHDDELPGARARRDLQSRGPGQPHRQHAGPAHRPRDQLPQPADDSRGVPAAQPDDESRVRRHAADLRPARSVAGRRIAPGAADGHQRHQQGRRRALPPRLQQRLRRARLFAPPDQRLRPATAHPAQPAGIHRLVHPPRARGTARSRSTATARRCATSSTSTMWRMRSCGREPPTRATATCSTSAAASRSPIATW